MSDIILMSITVTIDDDRDQLRRMNAELVETVVGQRRQIDELEHQLQLLLRRIYGPRSERINPDQPLLFDEPAVSPVSAPPPEDEPRTPQKRCHGRKKLSPLLERVRIECDLTELEKLCPCCSTLRMRIGEDASERLGYRGPAFFIKVYVKFKYVCQGCAGQHVAAVMPAELLPKTTADPSLLAHIAVSKFVDHLPLHRLEGILDRHGMELNRSTLGGWLAGIAAALQPVYHLMVSLMLKSKVIHTDDTPVTQLDPHHPGGSRTGRVWVYIGDRNYPYIVFDATENRRRDGPQAFLQHYRGYLQADAFGGYDGIYAGGVTEVACWAHARRKFYDARTSAPAEAAEALARIGQLYAIEKAAKELSPAERAALRQREAVPILKVLRARLDAWRPNALPKGPLGQAIGYATNQWTALNVYATDGNLAIDNNRAERTLRGIAVGRKNWMFFGNANGGRTAATLMSFTTTCTDLGINPQAYLTDLFTRLPLTPPDQLESLLPDRWAATRPD